MSDWHNIQMPELWESYELELDQPVTAWTDDGETRVTIPAGTTLHVRRLLTARRDEG